jgi:DNA-binding NtrC family response regulator
VGKEVLAQAIHSSSSRSPYKILCLNCCALSEPLLESELFGHERGAFTGALRAKVGLLESAHGATLFLDEVGDMPLALQAKLLRVLEQKEVTRVGAVQARPIDIRIISATNRDLEAEIRAGRFRQDLFFRLNGVSIVLPPLRERRDEITPLAHRFLVSACRASGLAPPPISNDALEALQQYDWPGNIRELRNVVERALLLCGDGAIEAQHLRLHRPRTSSPPRPEPGENPTIPPPRSAEEQSPTTIPSPDVGLEGIVWSRDQVRLRTIEALQACRGNQTRAAALLGISRRTLVSRLTEFGLPRPRKRAE